MAPPAPSSSSSSRSAYYFLAVVPILLGALLLLVRPDALALFSPDHPLSPFPKSARREGAEYAPYVLPPLPYAYDALEPDFDKETMEVHHARHHQTYVNNLNAALESAASASGGEGAAAADALSALSLDELLANLDKVPAAQRNAVRNSAGGHANHGLFWRGLKKGTTLEEGTPLRTAIETAFGSVEAFQAEFEKAAASTFGSGWVWLVVSSSEAPGGAGGNALQIVTTANQDSPLMGVEVAGCSGTPVLALDVWEHAYYLQYQNRRPDYVKAFWNVVNWDEASRLYNAAAGVAN